jgi:hypothetical protein
MLIELSDGRVANVKFAYDNGNNDPIVKAVRQEREALYRSEVSPTTGKVPFDIRDHLKVLDAAIGKLLKGKKQTITCELTVLQAETIQRATSYTVTWKSGFLVDCRREALIRCLENVFPAKKRLYFDVYREIPENRPFRKQIWNALLRGGLNPVQKSQVQKLKEQIRQLKKNIGIDMASGEDETVIRPAPDNNDMPF